MSESGSERGQHRLDDHEIELVNGRYLDLACPSPDSITLEAVAHGLAHTCRYAGQTRRFYSVAEHAVLVAMKVEYEGGDRTAQLAALHHDDAEAFVGDIARPLKTLLLGYAEIEDRVQLAISRALDLPEPDDYLRAWVKRADGWALACEAYHLLPSRGSGWWSEGLYSPDHEYLPPKREYGVPAEIARDRFIDYHLRLIGMRTRRAEAMVSSEEGSDDAR